MMTPEYRAARIAFLDVELARLVHAREQAHMRAFHRWSFEVLPQDPDAPLTPPDTLDLDVAIHDLLDELETLTNEGT